MSWKITFAVERTPKTNIEQKNLPATVAPNDEDQDEENKLKEDANRETYAKYSEHLWELRKNNQQEADKTLLTISSALLALSVTFLKDVAGKSDGKVNNPLWLYVCWGGFVIAIALTLISFSFGVKSIDNELKRSEKYYLDNDNSAFAKKNGWTVATQFCGFLASLGFILGLIAAACFVGSNVASKATDISPMNNSDTKKTPQTPSPPVKQPPSVPQSPGRGQEHKQGITAPPPPPKK